MRLRRFYAKCRSVSYSEEDHAEHPVALRNQRIGAIAYWA